MPARSRSRKNRKSPRRSQVRVSRKRKNLRRSSSRRIPPLKKGLLKKYGYSADKSASERHSSLRKASKAYGPGGLVRKLNAICVLNRNRSPKNASKFCADKRWVQNTLLKKKSSSRRKITRPSRRKKSVKRQSRRR